MGTSLYEQYRKEQSDPKKPASLYDQYLAERGNVVERGLKGAAEGLTNLMLHPIESAKSMITAPVHSFENAIAPSKKGAEKLNADPQFQGRIAARFGQGVKMEGVTGKEKAAGIAQTLGNVAFPGVFGAVQKATLPLGPLVSRAMGLATGGAMVGAANNPDDPVAGAITGGVATPVLGAVAGGAAKAVDKGLELNAVRKQVKAAVPLDKRAIELDREIEQATRANYGQAEAEGAANGGTSPALAKALEHPRVAKFVELIRGDDEGASMSDADVAREVYKLMSKQRRGLKSQMEVSGYDAAKDLEANRIGAAMKQLKDATAQASQKPPITLDIARETTVVDPKITAGRDAMSGPVLEGTAGRARGDAAQVALDPSGKAVRVSPRDVQGPAGPAFQLRAQPDKVVPGVEVETPSMRIQTAPAEDVGPLMPSFPKAVAEKARMEGERAAFNEGSDAGKRLIRGTSIAGKRLVDKSPEAFRIKERTPGEAARAKEGLLGRAKEEISLVPNITPQSTFWGTMAGAARPFKRLNDLSPVINDLDRQAGNTPRQALEIEQILKALGLVNAPFSNQP